MLNANMKY